MPILWEDYQAPSPILPVKPPTKAKKSRGQTVWDVLASTVPFGPAVTKVPQVAQTSALSSVWNWLTVPRTTVPLTNISIPFASWGQPAPVTSPGLYSKQFGPPLPERAYTDTALRAAIVALQNRWAGVDEIATAKLAAADGNQAAIDALNAYYAPLEGTNALSTVETIGGNVYIRNADGSLSYVGKAGAAEGTTAWYQQQGAGINLGQPYPTPKDEFGRTATWNAEAQTWAYPPNFGSPPYEEELRARREQNAWQQTQTAMSLAAQMLEAWEQRRQEAQRNPRSWIEYWQMQPEHGGGPPSMAYTTTPTGESVGYAIPGRASTATPPMPEYLSNIGADWIPGVNMPSQQQFNWLNPSQQQGWLGYATYKPSEMGLNEQDIYRLMQRLWETWSSPRAQYSPAYQR